MVNKESLEVIDKPVEGVTVEYELPKFWHRVMGNFIDFLIFVLLFFILFIPTNSIVINTPSYKKADAEVTEYREDCGLFMYSTTRRIYELYPTWYDYNNDTAYPSRVIGCKTAIGKFQDYVRSQLGDQTADKVVQDYKTARLSTQTSYKGVKLFVEDGGEVIDNPAIDVVIAANNESKAKVYYDVFYNIYILQNANGYLITLFPSYYHSMKVMSNFLFFCEFPIAYSLAAILTYFVPGLFLRRGRCSLGKMLFKIGHVDGRTLSPSFPRYLSRFAILFFAELILSLFTFGIPFIISFTMMAFTKKKQGFPDYLLNLTEIDTSKAKIYYTRYEAALDASKAHKDPVKFKMINKE